LEKKIEESNTQQGMTVKLERHDSPTSILRLTTACTDSPGHAMNRKLQPVTLAVIRIY